MTPEAREIAEAEKIDALFAEAEEFYELAKGARIEERRRLLSEAGRLHDLAWEEKRRSEGNA